MTIWTIGPRAHHQRRSMRSVGREVAEFLRSIRSLRDLLAVLLLVAAIGVSLFVLGWACDMRGR